MHRPRDLVSRCPGLEPHAPRRGVPLPLVHESIVAAIVFHRDPSTCCFAGLGHPDPSARGRCLWGTPLRSDESDGLNRAYVPQAGWAGDVERAVSALFIRP